MCIVLATTAHPSYALIVLDNRDEFILRPTSRPHWWSAHRQEILSARDLQREEQGTWLGITKTGNLAVLTNYRETDTNDADHPVQGTRSRGGMVTAWLTSPEDESTEEFVHRLLEGDGVKGVGGFSLLCGKLRRRKDASQELEPLAIVSNRSEDPECVPWIAESRGEVYGLSNTSYLDPETWPKVKMGKEKVLEAVVQAIEGNLSDEELMDRLFGVLDINTLPILHGVDFEEYMNELRKSIFIPSINDTTTPQGTLKAEEIASTDIEAVKRDLSTNGLANATTETKREEKVEPAASNGMTGIYGTQRQTIILVDWEGNVTFKERSLWDEKGNPITRGKADMTFKFKIDGWNGESKGNEFHTLSVL